MKFNKPFILIGLALLAVLLISQASLQVNALTTLPATVIDDFEDGDASDWIFFGGNAAGGGGGAFSDRPQEGGFYLSTGWGGDGTASGFYGGFFRNSDNAAQTTPPTDPWFNVWVLNQSDATVDQYTLEITIREDLNGDGWTDGAEDSFRLDKIFTTASFNDEWTLLTAPVSSFTNLGTGGDGTFDGNLDEVVVVVSGVLGASGSTVEVDFDQFSFTSGGPVVSEGPLVFDDMEHGDPFGNGWFAFGGSVGGGGIGAESADLPPSDGGAFSLGTGWGSGGVPGFFGGFGRTNPTDLTGVDHFNLWINPDAGQDYTLEINLQEDDNGDDAANTADDDEFQFNCVVSPTGPCAISGGGWQQISIPLDDFFDDNSFFTGGNGILDAVSVANGGNGQLINIVIAIVGNSGSDATFRTDYWAFSEGPLVIPTLIVDDFESGLPSGIDGDGNLIGFYIFEGPDAVVSYSETDAPPAPVPASATGNTVLQIDSNVPAGSWGGVVHGFENTAVDTWITQDWSQFEGISFWLYGNNSGAILFLDVLDNRAPGTNGDTAERYSLDIVDDFSGWQYFEIPFASLNRKEVGNGAPNDGLNLTQVHGYAFGVFSAGQAFVNYVDDVALYGIAELPELSVGFTANNYDIPEGTTGQITVGLNRSLGDDDPEQVTVDYAVVMGTAVPDRDYIHPPDGTLTFVKGGPSELSFSLETLDDGKFEGSERLILQLSNPVDAAEGFIMQAAATIQDDETYNPLLIDDFEQGAYLWNADSLVLSTPEIVSGTAYEKVLEAAPLAGLSPADAKAQVIADLSALLPTGNSKDDQRIEKAIARLELSLNDNYWRNDYYLIEPQGKHIFNRDKQAIQELMKVVAAGNAVADAAQTAINQLLSVDAALVQLAIDQAVANGGLEDKIAEALIEQANAEAAITQGDYDEAAANFREAWHNASKAIKGLTLAPVTFGREFAIGQDWSLTEGLTFMYYGQGTGDTITLELLDNRAPDPGPSGWSMVWNDEFNDPAGTPPNPANWGYEIGDGTINGIPGWGNDELQYYTDSTENVATDGNGNLVITAKEADGSLQCYYGPCEYTSARLISWHKAEFAYGRIESRIQVPDGEDGLWPAFWSLGTDIDVVGWPQTGEIDIMEYVSRIPDEIFGTVHGPGYSGGSAYGNIYPFPDGVAGDYHTFAIEWQPDRIEWYVDGILYHTATPADVAPNEWVFNDPVFLLFNLAIGGNFGGEVSPDLTMPQELTIDYVRVYQGPDTAERFEATFVDDFTGWQEVSVPFPAFTRSGEQPAGAPDDGLTLTEVWGYGFKLPANSATATAMVDQVQLNVPTEVTVTNTNDDGPGSLRQAINLVASDGLIFFDPSLANSTINLTSGPLVINKTVTVDASGVSGITVSGGGVDRVLVVEQAGVATIDGLTFANGYGWQLAGGILNNGSLTLNNATVTNNVMATDAGDFWQGGGGIYNGENATLNLIDSTVSNNTAGWSGGGIYSFFNSTMTVERSTISGNVSNDVGGGIRSLGNAEIVNSTISGNESTGWYGGAMFVTDGVVNMTNVTVAGNISPASAPADIFVGTFTDASATLTLTNSIVSSAGENCFFAPWGAGVVTLTADHNNLFTDGTCFAGASDQVVADAGLGALADNGGATLTHALLAGSGAIDAADTAVCPTIDQRGIARDAACDIGAFEYVP